MEVFSESIEVKLDAGIDMADITGNLERLVNILQIRDGTLSATMSGSTGSLTAIEHEPGVMEDLRRTINRMAPPEIDYEHEKAWHDGNGHSHVQAAIIGPSICMQIRDGKMLRGTWQQVVAVNHDNRARKRSVSVTITGQR